ncbi:MAG: TolC family protein [Deltaproteobacteria bacterium]|nr:TolC family protein [Deltaproteobacteria bacterium]
MAAAFAFAPLLVVSAAAAAPLDALIAEAWTQSPDVARAAADVAAAEAKVAQLSVVLPNPEVEAGVRSDIVFARQGELDAEVAVLQELAWPGARLARKDGAETSVRAARLRLALARLDVAARVEAGVGASAAAADNARVREEIATGARSLAEAARRRAEAGAAGALEATLARADEALAEAALADARAGLAAELAALCALVARDDCNALSTQVVWPALAALPVLGSSDSAVRVDVHAATLNLEAAQRQIDGAELDRLPTARIGIGYGFDQSVLDSPFLPQNVTDPDHVAGVTLAVTLPVWDWKTGEIALARAEAARADAELRGVRRAATASMSTALARFRAASTGAERLAATEADVTRALSDVQNAYVAGALGLDEALTTRDRLLRTRLELVDAKRRQVEAHAAALVALADPRLVGIEVAP